MVTDEDNSGVFIKRLLLYPADEFNRFWRWISYCVCILIVIRFRSVFGQISVRHMGVGSFNYQVERLACFIKRCCLVLCKFIKLIIFITPEYFVILWGQHIVIKCISVVNNLKITMLFKQIIKAAEVCICTQNDGIVIALLLEHFAKAVGAVYEIVFLTVRIWLAGRFHRYTEILVNHRCQRPGCADDLHRSAEFVVGVRECHSFIWKFSQLRHKVCFHISAKIFGKVGILQWFKVNIYNVPFLFREFDLRCSGVNIVLFYEIWFVKQGLNVCFRNMNRFIRIKKRNKQKTYR